MRILELLVVALVVTLSLPWAPGVHELLWRESEDHVTAFGSILLLMQPLLGYILFPAFALPLLATGARRSARQRRIQPPLAIAVLAIAVLALWRPAVPD